MMSKYNKQVNVRQLKKPLNVCKLTAITAMMVKTTTPMIPPYFTVSLNFSYCLHIVHLKHISHC